VVADANGPNGGDQVAENDAAAANAASRQYDWRPRPDPTVLTTQQLRETEAVLNRTIKGRVAALRELLETRLDGMDKATAVNAGEVTHIHGEIDHVRDRLREERAGEIQNLRELLTERIDGIDKATKLLAANQDRAPSDTDKAIGALRELIQSQLGQVEAVANEKFRAIEGTFASNALALTAALATQKEAAAEQNKSNTLAISKSEQATKETISANAAQTTAGLKSQEATINDLKERLVRLEAGGVGRTEQRGEQRKDDTYSQMERMLAENRVRAALTMAISVVAVIVSVVVAIVLIVHHG
jgi:hypothetical protein